MSLAYKMIESPIGKLKLVASNKGLVAILWEKDNPCRVRLSELVADKQHPVLVETEHQLGEYFDGKRQAFSIPLDLRGTRFQKRYGRPCLPSHLERRGAMDSSRSNEGTLERHERSAPPTEETLYR
jgi:hypothetical protein